jgi:hypothetical protein
MKLELILMQKMVEAGWQLGRAESEVAWQESL